MTKSIEDELNLPRLEDALKAHDGDQVVPETATEVSEEVEQMANALKNVDPSSLAEIDPMGVATHSVESSEIYAEAMKAYKDLLDLGFNIEAKHAGANAFGPAAKMLEIALKASQSKTNKKMEQIKTIMEKERHDRDMRNDQEDGVIEGESGPSFMAFRKDLIDKIRKGEI